MPKTPRNEVAQAVIARISASNDTAALAKEIAAYLIDQGREADLETIMRDVMQLRRDKSIVEADIRTAYPVDAATLTEVTELVKREFPASNTVVASQTIDPEIVGGMRIVTANEQLDLSVRGKLDMFKRLTHRGNVS